MLNSATSSYLTSSDSHSFNSISASGFVSASELIGATAITLAGDRRTSWPTGGTGGGSGIFTEIGTSDVFRTTSSLQISSSVSISSSLNVAGTIGNIDQLTDVSSSGIERDMVLKWNGSQFVPAVYDYSFEFTIASFNCSFTNAYSGESDTQQLIGAGNWKDVGEVTFTATYNNGPPDSADIEEIDQSPDQVLDDWSTPFATDTNASAIPYPSSVNGDREFKLTAEAGAGDKTETLTKIYFRNYRYYGASSDAGTYDQDITGSLSKEISNSKTTSNKTISSTTDKYIFWVYRNALGAVSNFGGTSYPGFTFGTTTGNQIAISMSLHGDDYSFKNAAGYTENYRIYRSANTIADSSGKLDVTSTLINYVYYGELNKASTGDGANTYTAADVTASANLASAISSQGGLVSNMAGNVSMTVNCGGSEHAYIAYPSRLGAIGAGTGITIGGSDVLSDFYNDANSGNELLIPNEYGYEETYYVYVSKNPGFLDPTTIVVSL